jgi:hypothetical protein
LSIFGPLESYLKDVQRFLYFDPNINSVIINHHIRILICSIGFRVITIQKHLPQLQVTTNRDDVQQGTGSAPKLESYKTNVECEIWNQTVVASALTICLRVTL